MWNKWVQVEGPGEQGSGGFSKLCSWNNTEL